jgi:hypothetical protein
MAKQAKGTPRPPAQICFHLSFSTLSPGAIIPPGNWGRLIRAAGWTHIEAVREMALEDARLSRFPHRPSRLESAFVFLTEREAHNFRTMNSAFRHHILYRVSLAKPPADSHVTDSRFSHPYGTLRHNWADAYWLDISLQRAAIPGVDWNHNTWTIELREMLTLSELIVEERFK